MGIDYAMYVFLKKLDGEKGMGGVISSDFRPGKRCVEQIELQDSLPGVRPYLDYGAQLWSPYYRMHRGLFERVQRRLTKMTDNT